MLWRFEMHTHTNYSHDSLCNRWFYLLMLKLRKIKAIAITDHNEIAGAFKFKAFLQKYGIFVVIGEEIFSSDGEIIGLFLQHKIEPGLSAEETVRQIKQQGGIVYIPHPFDEKRYRSVLSQKALEKIKADVDIIEIHNGRNSKAYFSTRQQQIANDIPTAYQLIGSDAHTFFELGRNINKMPIFSNKQQFMLALPAAQFEKKQCIQFSHFVTKIVRVVKKSRQLVNRGEV